ncbi:glutathione S-transferase-like protein [Sinorhizobium medicae]|nr:glutathione S-transferase-like protein [Sinorhizobium medicae]
MVWGIYVERVSKPAKGAIADEAAIGGALPKARTCLKAVSETMGTAPWLAGESISLADLYAAPIFDYFLTAPEGQEIFRDHENLVAWRSRISARRSMRDTLPL